MKFVLLSTLFIITACSSITRQPASSSEVTAMFSPREGTQAFDNIYKNISNAKKYAYITIYSWSSKVKQLEVAMRSACDNGAKVHVVVHRNLFKAGYFKTRIQEIEESSCVEFRGAHRKLHEKFVIVDDQFLVNSSANFSTKAASTFNETFIFFEGNNLDKEHSNILSEFKREFALLWNSGDDLISKDDKPTASLAIPVNASDDNKVDLFSSSLNIDYTEIGTSKDGTTLATKTRSKSWIVQDEVIESIKRAKKNIYLNVNHFYLKKIAQEIVNAAKRGVEIKIVADNQEYKPNSKSVQIPYIVKEWMKLNKGVNPPVRFKFYSFSPSIKFTRMNHNKTILIDYNTKKTELITGSYNFSKTAERTQYDNLVFFSGKKYDHIYSAVVDDFNYIWDLNRGEKSISTIVDTLVEEDKNLVKLHSPMAVSLDWYELQTLKKYLQKKYKVPFNRYRELNKCYGYDYKTKKFIGCD